ncbi:phosphotransferase family enzyme [Actinomadura pelletieri DSM 43383]|uniref:Phosphotransferase family enzyme n=1 Tax=Actinomadura pelletieri DSM 43383 TaxID=1120940 RepID=A0A495QS94_9ACTN|nr:phosphotransferase [Actinomadura pelletieri]RKS76385.1 phosphotransferase family enzyme [Actinomadura pelletieri DSM 43383]
MRGEWARLPEHIRIGIAERVGQVRSVQAASGGSNAAFAASVTGTVGRAFVKAAPKAAPDDDGAQVRALRREALINPCVPEFAPRLLWTVEAGGWLAVGFEHIDGRHADYSPGSPDLNTLVKTIRRLQSTPCPDAVVMRVERRWEPFVPDVSAMAGDALLHTDLNPRNLLITPHHRTYVVDWGFASRGAPWIEIGQVIPWLIHAGHPPADAERWAALFPSWVDAVPSVINSYAHASAERWRQRATTNPAAPPPANLAVAQRWAGHRVVRAL